MTGIIDAAATRRSVVRRVSVRICPQRAHTNGSRRAKLPPQLLVKSNGAWGRGTG